MDFSRLARIVFAGVYFVIRAKGNLLIKHCFDASPNPLKTQIWIAVDGYPGLWIFVKYLHPFYGGNRPKSAPGK